MLNWNESCNWTKAEFDRAVGTAFKDPGKKAVTLDVEHSDRKNMDDIIQWARDAGYDAREINCDTIRVSRKEG